MEDAKNFKERNLMTAQKYVIIFLVTTKITINFRTMENLQAERRKREKELETLRNSEPLVRSLFLSFSLKFFNAEN
jgi:hypothetical protein